MMFKFRVKEIVSKKYRQSKYQVLLSLIDSDGSIYISKSVTDEVNNILLIPLYNQSEIDFWTENIGNETTINITFS